MEKYNSRHGWMQRVLVVRFQHCNNTNILTLAKAFATIIWINYRYYRNIITHDVSIYYILDVLHFYYNIPCAGQILNAVCVHTMPLNVYVCGRFCFQVWASQKQRWRSRDENDIVTSHGHRIDSRIIRINVSVHNGINVFELTFSASSKYPLVG